VSYSGKRGSVLRYICQRGALDNGAPRCIGFGGVPVDAVISREVLRIVQPAALEAAVMASEEIARKRDEVLAALQRDLEAAKYSASRAQRQYDAADPENRLIAAELERRWDQALQRVRAIENQMLCICVVKAWLSRRLEKSWSNWLASCKWYGKALTSRCA
jgi:hypothetical protein